MSKMKVLVLDTNTLLRFLLDDVLSQTKEIRKKIELAKLGKIKLVVPQIVVFEIVYALTKEYGFKIEEVIGVLRRLLINKDLQIQDEDIFEQTLRIFSKKLSLADCFIYFFAKKNNAELFTFDKNLQKAFRATSL
ncbi:MAG: twitching motility protein PilT [Microgenomates group bacterium Gr01-1014_7]|nr:MAG: twitching motility protein PilT [Microgenomates group bacterium Gr01-1014_7]